MSYRMTLAEGSLTHSDISHCQREGVITQSASVRPFLYAFTKSLDPNFSSV